MVLTSSHLAFSNPTALRVPPRFARTSTTCPTSNSSLPHLSHPVVRAVQSSASTGTGTGTDTDVFGETLDVGFAPAGEYLYRDATGRSFERRLADLVSSGELSADSGIQLQGWYTSYIQACLDNPDFRSFAARHAEQMFTGLLELSRQCAADPIPFESVHAALRSPIDFYMFGFQFALPLYDRAKSKVCGAHNLRRIEQLIQSGENVILLSNHQSEGDPYAIDFLFRLAGGVTHPVCRDIYFMAGDRVREDPVVMPFSAGRNLLTVFSKKHMDDEPGTKQAKITHNKRTLAQTIELFRAGGTLIWMAPSGGRDRRKEPGAPVEISRFDSAAIDMMKLTAAKSGAKVHFFPIALWSYDMLPPPTSVGGSQMGEERTANFIPMHLFVGDEIQWDEIVPASVKDKAQRREAQRDYIQKVVEDGYRQIGGYDY